MSCQCFVSDAPEPFLPVKIRENPFNLFANVEPNYGNHSKAHYAIDGDTIGIYLTEWLRFLIQLSCNVFNDCKSGVRNAFGDVGGCEMLNEAIITQFVQALEIATFFRVIKGTLSSFWYVHWVKW